MKRFRASSNESEDGLPSYLSRLTQTALLTAEEEIALTEAARTGCEESRRKLIMANMRLVINIARSYQNKALPLEDLIQEGAIGLMQAADRFDPKKGFRFSTYATHWVRQSIGRAIDNKAKTIRLPTHVSQTLRRIERTRLELMSDLGREPTSDEIGERLGLTTARMQSLLQASQDLLSLDMRVGERDSTTLGAMIQDEDAKDAEELILTAELLEELHDVIRQLNEREQLVISRRLRQGPGKANQVRAELSEEMAMSRDRVRQIEVQAIKKLRLMAARRRISDLLEDP
jgi:RNA polymerase primary sigma factor